MEHVLPMKVAYQMGPCMLHTVESEVKHTEQERCGLTECLHGRRSNTMCPCVAG